MARLRKSGKLTFLRAHDGGFGFGPDSDHIDGDVIGRISAEPDHAFGLEMRNDNKLPAHEAMFALLRDGFNQDWDTTVEYDLDDNRKNGDLFRIELRK